MSALLILSAFANLFAGVVLAYAIVCRLNDRAEIRRLRDSLKRLGAAFWWIDVKPSRDALEAFPSDDRAERIAPTLASKEAA